MVRPLALLIALAACGGSPPPSSPPPPAPAAQPDDAVPWAEEPLSLGAAPQVYLTEWQRAGNRARCPLLVATNLGAGVGAAARRADFGEGWGVAYDKPGLPGTGDDGMRCVDCGRAAFGVAGTAATRGASGSWSHEIKWRDGSRVRYGIGGAGRQNAYVEPTGVDCVYHVWSSVSEEHLLTLLRGLRRVAGM